MVVGVNQASEIEYWDPLSRLNLETNDAPTFNELATGVYGLISGGENALAKMRGQ